MAVAMRSSVVCFVAASVGVVLATATSNHQAVIREQSLLQVWEGALNGANAAARDTPVTRVVNLLKEISQTLEKEQQEDEDLYKKLGCWCHDNGYEKDASISSSEAKIAELEATVESFTAKEAELKTSLKEIEADVASNKAGLAEATALREKQAQEFHGGEMDSIQAIENMKAALTVLEKVQPAPKSSVAGGAIFKTEREAWSLISIKSATASAKGDHAVHSLDEFMRRNGFDGAATMAAGTSVPSKFLQQETRAAEPTPGWSLEDEAIVKAAMRSASAFVQARHGQQYYPAYNSQSGEIMGVLKQLKEEMEADLAESQKHETAQAAAFEELRSAKTQEIESGEKMAEEKEDELAVTVNSLAEAKEDLGQESAALGESREFLKNLKETCANAETNFQARKSARLEEIKAVGETIEILTADEARDAMTGTYKFVQLASSSSAGKRRKEAAMALRQANKRVRDPRLSILATSVELDAFTKVKKAIDDMIAMLKVQEEDEVKKSDYCKSELQENEMSIAKTADEKANLEAKSTKLSEDIKALEAGIADAKAQIAQLQVDLQRAAENRIADNLEFQKTLVDQTLTVEVLHRALDKLAAFYDSEAFVQQALTAKQTPPVPQMEYKKSQGAAGVMQMIEKLIQEANVLIADAKKAEQDEQAAYEQTVADTNASVGGLQEEVTTKTKTLAATTKDKQETEADIAETSTELDGLNKFNGELHAECDYVLKNFAVRQEARAQEIEALQQAKQILSGASLS